MENSGNNRYELLFMDDDNSAPVLTNAVGASCKTKQPSNSSVPKKAKEPAKKVNVSEKENKAGTLNRADRKTATGNSQSSIKAKPSVSNGKTTNEIIRPGHTSGGEKTLGTRHVNFAPQNNETREQRNNRRPPRREGGDNKRFGKREFDRQSGSDKTGVKAVDKRDGAGAHNWGSIKQEIDDINQETPNGVPNDGSLTDKEESANEQTSELAGSEQERTKEMTLDEYKALRSQRTKPQFNIRKAGEGEDNAQWKKMIILKKSNENGDSEEEMEYDPSMYPQRVGRLQRIVDIQFNFKDGRRGGFGRGHGRAAGHRLGAGGPDRFGARKNVLDENGTNAYLDRSRFKDKQQRTASKPLKVDDERQFPTLN